jgi:hypothetical protein
MSCSHGAVRRYLGNPTAHRAVATLRMMRAQAEAIEKTGDPV